jgi:hypothetical protein
LFSQGLGLLLQEGGKGTGDQSRRSRLGELFHGSEVDILTSAFVPEGTPGDNFQRVGIRLK